MDEERKYEKHNLIYNVELVRMKKRNRKNTQSHIQCVISQPSKKEVTLLSRTRMNVEDITVNKIRQYRNTNRTLSHACGI